MDDTNSDGTAHVHKLDFDKDLSERGGCMPSYEGVDFKCPNCNAYTTLWTAINFGECIECDMEMAVYIGFGDENDGR
ncbi:hypothetical protein [Halococcus sp. AFM35]|uniref:hypothetical protein n=1 Tax=Halococcus sp. AFM35 TaxID=3421653 RepID=UPI003EC016C9